MLITLAQNSYACRCNHLISIENAYSQADIVLIGKVITLKGSPYIKGGAKAYIDVDKSWKKSTPISVKVLTSTTCAFDFKVGSQYLLYLYKVKDNDHYIARACQGNTLLSEAESDLQWLKKNADQANKIINSEDQVKLIDIDLSNK